MNEVLRYRRALQRLIQVEETKFMRRNAAQPMEAFPMSTGTSLRSLARTSLSVAATTAILSMVVAKIARADDPARIVKSMAEYLASQKSLSASFDNDIEIITPELQKIQFASSGQMKLNRPDKLRVRRTGVYADVELVYDGRTISIYGNKPKSYVQAELPGTVDQMIDALQARSGVACRGQICCSPTPST
jgi:hypothetical protein